MSGELRVQDLVTKKLQELDITPTLVVFTYQGGYSDGMLSITVCLKEDLDQILDYLEYKTQCDQSGYWINWKTKTIILSGLALIDFYSKL